VSLNDYRLRYQTYRQDSDLREAHRQFPWICIWDDHEHANDSWKGGAQNHQPETEGSWNQRTQNSVKAYYEWMPIRVQNQENLAEIYRNFNFGDLFQLIMLESRIIARDQQLEDRLLTNDKTLNNPNRRLLGEKQMNWLEKRLQENTAQWVILGQQVMMSPLLIDAPMINPKIGNSDQWDGYPAERQRIYNLIDKYKIKNFVVLTGDIHTAWSSNLPRENYNPSFPRHTTYGVEFVTASITSRNLTNKVPLIHKAVKTANPHFKFVDVYAHGYFVLDITKDRIQCDHIFVDNIKSKVYKEIIGKSYLVNDGEAFLRKAKSKSEKLENNPALAP
jgi:alkaline phosphatase D